MCVGGNYVNCALSLRRFYCITGGQGNHSDHSVLAHCTNCAIPYQSILIKATRQQFVL